MDGLARARDSSSSYRHLRRAICNWVARNGTDDRTSDGTGDWTVRAGLTDLNGVPLSRGPGVLSPAAASVSLVVVVGVHAMVSQWLLRRSAWCGD